MSEPVLIHPGFHKTGTTYLQEVVFANGPSFVQPWSRQLVYDHIIDPHEFAFDAGAAKVAFEAARSSSAVGALAVLSEEGLCGNPFNGAREAGVHARKLKALFDNAYILLTVRSQPGMLRAVYIQYLKAYGRRSPEAFYQPPRYPEFSAFDPDVYQYDRLAECYAALFGKNRVLVLPQELLQRDEQAFVAEIARFTGRDIDLAAQDKGKAEGRNISPSPAGVPFLRLGNHFVSSAFSESGFGNWSAKIGSMFRSMGYRKTPLFRGKTTEFQSLIAGYAGRYASSNTQLQTFCPVDLATFGYETI
jgi:hypothetical protein